MTVSQNVFHSALLDPVQDVPEGLTDGHGQPAGRRFAVYRNNVAHSLTEALTLSFPAIHKLIGAQNFQKLALSFLRQHPPTVPIMSQYGNEMPTFLERFEPLAHLGYLPDVARLEQAIRVSYHAADATPADPAILQTLPPEALASVRFTLAPSLRLVRSRWPVHGIWAYNLEDGPKPVAGPESALILRPGFDPQVRRICDATAEFIAQVQAGAELGHAHDAAQKVNGDFDLSQALGLLLGGQAITEIEAGPSE